MAKSTTGCYNQAMESLIKADIFFFISTIALIFFTVLGIIICYYVIKILKNVKDSTDALKDEVRAAGQKLGELEQKIADSFLFNFLFSKKKGKK